MNLFLICVPISIVFFVGSNAIALESLYKETHTNLNKDVRPIRSPPINRDKEIHQKLKLISKLVDDLKKQRNCSSGDVVTHCKDLWIPETLLRLSVRLAGRTNNNNNNKQATKREKKIQDQHIRINKLMEKLTDVTQCSDEKKTEKETSGKSGLAKLERKKEGKDAKEGDKNGSGDGAGDDNGSADGTGDENGSGNELEDKRGFGDEKGDKNGSQDETGDKTGSGNDSGSGNDTESGNETEDENDTDTESKCDYSHFGDVHTMLLPPNDCKIHKTGITEQDKEDILRFHNLLRAKVARGEETEGNPGPQPPAANMRELVWNDQLAEVAEAWAKQCKQEHDHVGARKICSRNYFVNQNLHFYFGFSNQVNWENAINEWYIEVKDVPIDLVSSYRSLLPVKIGHYTQVVWAETTEVGCGIVHYETTYADKVLPESKIYACNYGKAGNVLTMPVYIEGPTASLCPFGQSQNYPDLCNPDTQNSN